MIKDNINNPLFFLFTCVRNGRQYINRLFESILSQTKVNFVHYIYEDGSTDPVNDLVTIYKEKAAKLQQPFKVIYDKNPINIGLNMATKHCISKCDCPYFIWIDCDNWVDKDFFKNLEETVKKSKKSSLIRTTLCSQTDNYSLSTSNIVLKPYDRIFQLKELMRGTYVYSFFAVKNSFYKEINKQNIMLDSKIFYNDDQILLLMLLSKNCDFAYSFNSIGHFLIRKDSVSSKNLPFHAAKDDQIEFCYKISKEYGDFVKYYYIIKSILFKIDNSVTTYKEKSNQLDLVLTYSKKYRIPLNVFNVKNFKLKRVKYFIFKLMGK